jgi:phosphoglycerate kinase
VSDKVGVIRSLLGRVDVLLLGGGIGNTFAFAMDRPIGESLADRDFSGDARAILDEAEHQHVAIHVPIDVVVAPDMEGEGEVAPADQVEESDHIFDIGPETVREYAGVIAGAKTVFWNGPMGVFEKPQFAKGTIGIAQAVAQSESYSVIGGGDSLAAVETAGVADRIDHLSTGGGASLEFLEGQVLPGVAAIAASGGEA